MSKEKTKFYFKLKCRSNNKEQWHILRTYEHDGTIKSKIDALNKANEDKFNWQIYHDLARHQFVIE